MKQIIRRYISGDYSSFFKYYENDKGERHGIQVTYWDDYVHVWAKINYVNGKKYGLETDQYSSGKLMECKYHL